MKVGVIREHHLYSFCVGENHVVSYLQLLGRAGVKSALLIELVVLVDGAHHLAQTEICDGLIFLFELFLLVNSHISLVLICVSSEILGLICGFCVFIGSFGIPSF